MMGFGLAGIFFVLAVVSMLVGDGRWGWWGADRRPPEAGGEASGEAAEEILKQRYARGEITREQYQLIKGDLGG
jgi:uncharacterized membrane protein